MHIRSRHYTVLLTLSVAAETGGGQGGPLFEHFDVTFGMYADVGNRTSTIHVHASGSVEYYTAAQLLAMLFAGSLSRDVP